MKGMLFVLAALSVLGLSSALYEADWTIKVQLACPDCTSKYVYQFRVGDDGEWQSPGPTVYVDQYEDIKITLHNHLHSEELTMHWHGIQQIGTPYQDGVHKITECGIPPMSSRTYTFNAGHQYGTYFYHSHVGMQRTQGLFGMIVIREPANKPFAYDEELPPLMVHDWFIEEEMTVAYKSTNVPYVFAGFPNGVLHNMQATPNCTVETTICNRWPSTTCNNCGDPTMCKGNYVLNAQPGKIYLLRILNAGTWGYLNTYIEGHTVTVVSAEGAYTVPYNTSTISTGPGQRYNVLIRTDKAISNWWIVSELKGVPGNRCRVQGFAILHYEGAADPVANGMTARQPAQMLLPGEYDQSLIKQHDSTVIPPPATADRTYIFHNAQVMLDGETISWTVRNTAFTMPTTPALHDAYFGTSLGERTGTEAIVVEEGDVVDVVLQNHYPGFVGDCDNHPWHLHGHDFWVMGQGSGEWNSTLTTSYNYVNPIYRDTTILRAVPISNAITGAQQACGWQVIRFKATNPGSWLLHCHNDVHMTMGMAAMFEVASEKIPNPPTDTVFCGTTSWSKIAALAKGAALESEGCDDDNNNWWRCYGDDGDATTDDDLWEDEDDDDSSTGNVININFAGMLSGVEVVSP